MYAAGRFRTSSENRDVPPKKKGTRKWRKFIHTGGAFSNLRAWRGVNDSHPGNMHRPIIKQGGDAALDDPLRETTP